MSKMTPAPGTPQTDHKGHAGGVGGALAAIAGAIVNGLVTGQWPDTPMWAEWGATLGAAALAWAANYLAVYYMPNAPK